MNISSKIASVLVFISIALSPLLVPLTTFAITTSTGSIEVVHQGTSGGIFSSSLGARANIDSKGSLTSDNPHTFKNLTPGRHVVFISNLQYYSEAAAVCSYQTGKSECSVGKSFTGVQCDPDFCAIAVNVSAGTVTKVVFQYTKIKDQNNPNTVANSDFNSSYPASADNVYSGGNGNPNGSATNGNNTGGGTGVMSLGPTTGGTGAGTVNTSPTTGSTNGGGTGGATDASGDWTNGLVPCGNDGTADQQATSCDFHQLVVLGQRLVNFLFFAAILMTVIILVITGYEYVTAGSNTGQLAKAKGKFKTIGIGFLLVLGAWLIINAVVTVLLNPNVGITNPLHSK